MKNCKKEKNYKLSIYKYNQSVRGDLTNYWIEKFNIDNISEIDDINKLNLKNFKNSKPIDFEDQIGFDREGYDGTNDLENINIISEEFIKYEEAIKIIQNTRLAVSKFLNVNCFQQVILKKLIRYLDYFSKREI